MHQSGIAIGPGLLTGRVNVFNDFIIHTYLEDDNGLSVGIEGPSNAGIRYFDNEDGTIKVSYKPTLKGVYRISVKANGVHVKGSPFDVNIFDDEIVDPFMPKSSLTSDEYSEGLFGSASKVKVSGRGLYRGITNVQSEIIVDTRKAGLGRVRWSMEGPGNIQQRHVHIVSGLHKLYYKADTRGTYIVRVVFNEQEVPGSPFKTRIM